MSRDFFRWFIRVILIILIIGGCCESFYFLGETTRDSNNPSQQSYKEDIYDYYNDY